jgi:hypothetical protein
MPVVVAVEPMLVALLEREALAAVVLEVLTEQADQLLLQTLAVGVVVLVLLVQDHTEAVQEVLVLSFFAI